MKKAPWFLLALFPVAASAAGTARNVILFLGDAGGIPTLHAASIHGHDQPQALFIHHLPHIGLMDTSAADVWTTDSAAGMTAIMTGRKTNDGVVAQSAAAVKNKVDGEPLQTLLEHAEQRGLSTGVITNMSIADATPAACYAHANYRKKPGEIFAQLAQPRFGDGVDIVIGAGRKSVLAATQALGLDVEARLRERGYTVLEDPAAFGRDATRVVAVTDNADFDPLPVVARTIEILSRNPKGYFLMVEWDMHTTDVRRGLDRVLKMDDLIRQTAAQVKDDTLIIFTADHSFDLRVRGGKRGVPLLPATDPAPDAPAAAKPNVRVDNSHTAEQVLVAAQGPGAEKVRGFIVNTDVFHIMMSAYGWETAP